MRVSVEGPARSGSRCLILTKPIPLGTSVLCGNTGASVDTGWDGAIVLVGADIGAIDVTTLPADRFDGTSVDVGIFEAGVGEGGFGR